MHRLLERQLKRHFGTTEVPEAWREFIAAVDAAYAKGDADVAFAGRTLNVMSVELTERNEVLRRERDEQAALALRLEEAHNQLLQSEKMASIGQLAAGVAHEINNPIGYIGSNLKTLGDYVADLLQVVDTCLSMKAVLPAAEQARMAEVCERVELDFLREDLVAMIGESREGIGRVKKIIQDLKDFSHVDDDVFGWADLRKGIESTLNIVANEVKYRADVARDYGDIPEIECLPSQLNQVFMNLLVNAAQAMPDDRRGEIVVRTRREGSDFVCVEIADNGSGIPKEVLGRIFDPFFTTKPIGKGTGLGLSLSYGIVQKHRGVIEVDSEIGRGTCFRILLPICRPEGAAGHDAPPACAPPGN